METTKAWMLGRRGAVIPVEFHPYGNEEDAEETLWAAEFLFRNTLLNPTKQIVLQFIKTYAVEELNSPDDEDLLDDLIYFTDPKVLGYKIFTPGFLQSIGEEILKAPVGDLDTLNKQVINRLNQEFLRARYGGMVNSTKGSSEMVFRVSSTGFNWFNNIWSFVYENRNRISTVTICRDEESTGESWYYSNGRLKYEQCPVNEFINQSGNPVVEQMNRSGYKVLTESSLNKALRSHISSGYVIISSRSGKYTPQENNESDNEMKKEIQNLGYSYVMTYGGYQEKGDSAVEVEPSFIVYPFKDVKEVGGEKNFNNFVNQMLNLGSDHEQETITVVPPNGGNPVWVDCETGNIVRKFEGGISINDLTKEYFTNIKRKKNRNKSFTFVECCYKSPNNLDSQRRMELDGEIWIKVQ